MQLWQYQSANINYCSFICTGVKPKVKEVSIWLTVYLQSLHEIHFVHKKVNIVDDTASDAYAVLSVHGSMQYVPISGIFSQLDVTNIRLYGLTPISVSGIYLSSLLP